MDEVAQVVVSRGAAPAASCAAGFYADGEWYWGIGAAGTLWPIADTPTTPGTIFDLASLTKPVVAIAAATELARGTLNWNGALQDEVPALRGTWAGTRTLDQCFSHRTGLAAHRELFQSHRNGLSTTLDQLFSRASNARCSSLESSDILPLYSDLGYILAGAAIERRLKRPLDEVVADTLAGLFHCRLELGSVRQWLRRDPESRQRCAPTEVVPWRGGLLRFRVHDENAWVLNGHGITGHAGLFGTAISMAQLGASVLDALAQRPSCFPESAARRVTDPRRGGSLCAGFDRKSETGSTAGSLAGADAFGHLGFTGTSIWCDPSRSAVVVLLTNRVCPNRSNIALRSMRANLHDAMFAWTDRQKANRPV